MIGQQGYFNQKCLRLIKVYLFVYLFCFLNKICIKNNDLYNEMADGVGFEPTEGFHLRRFSRPVLSTAQSPIHLLKLIKLAKD